MFNWIFQLNYVSVWRITYLLVIEKNQIHQNSRKLNIHLIIKRMKLNKIDKKPLFIEADSYFYNFFFEYLTSLSAKYLMNTKVLYNDF